MGLKAVLKKKTRFFTIDVELSCPEGQTLALVGPSGSGKTTIIRMLAGLEKPDEGLVRYGDEVLFDSARGLNLPPQKRNLGYVFQDYTLFPHLTMYGNAAFAAKDRSEVESLMEFFGIASLRDRKPHEVSGGERQRCAVCQALARNPRLLLLDEPFSALDVVTRRVLRGELRKITEKRTSPVDLRYTRHHGGPLYRQHTGAGRGGRGGHEVDGTDRRFRGRARGTRQGCQGAQALSVILGDIYENRQLFLRRIPSPR